MQLVDLRLMEDVIHITGAPDDSIIDWESISIDTILYEFNKEFWKTMKHLVASGMVPEGLSVYELARCAMVLTAEQYYPGHLERYQKLLNNLRKA